MTGREKLFRARAAHDHSPVTYIELFFDLVFVFAITQLSHRLLAHLTIGGALEAVILFLAIWWVWIYTSWTTNWLDPDHASVRLMLIAMMLSGLAMSSSIPSAFEANGWLFASSYAVMQIGRTSYMIWAARGVNAARRRNFTRILFYFLLSAPLWLAGAVADPAARPWYWLAALTIEYVAPFLMFHTPWIGRSTTSDWDISGAHMAERCALFIIIALGESVLVTGATYAELMPDPDTPTRIAFVISFISSAAMWWIYFDVGAKRGSQMISGGIVDAGLMARNAYTYLHIPIVAGIVVTAVADEKLLAHPTGHSDGLFILVTCGGPWLFLIGTQAFKWISAGVKYPPLSHFIGTICLIITATAGYFGHWQPLTIGLCSTGALLITAVWEWYSLHGGWQRWAPGMGWLFNVIPANPDPPTERD